MLKIESVTFKRDNKESKIENGIYIRSYDKGESLKSFVIDNKGNVLNEVFTMWFCTWISREFE